ncbi:MAG: aminotransferase class IV [Polyangiaceae bacterium]
MAEGPLVAIDGRFVAPDEATVSVFDRGFLYGDSVFEAARTYGGRLFRLDVHMQRLARSLEIVGIASPLSTEALQAEVTSLAEQALAQFRAADPTCELAVRFMVSRGSGPLGLKPVAGLTPRRVLFLSVYTPPPAELYANGIRVACIATFRPSDAAPGAKVGNYLESMLALQRASAVGADEALIVDGGGAVLEGTTSNVFLVVRDRIVTPMVDRILAGVTRRTVLEIASAAGLEIVESRITPSDLYAADEVFITSTLRGVMPVSRVDDHPISLGPRTRDLAARFDAFTRA